jgi:hypothetical protein
MISAHNWTPTSHLQGWVQDNLNRVADVHFMVHKKNAKRANELSDVCVKSFFIDPAPFTQFLHHKSEPRSSEDKPSECIDDLAEKFSKVYLITEQDSLSVSKNVSVCVVPDDFYGVYYYDKELSAHSEIFRQYNCFINRIDVLRQKFFYQLYANDLLELGYVSFRMKRSPDVYYPGVTDKDAFDYFHAQYWSAFDWIKPELDKIVPYVNFDTDQDLFDLTLQSKFSIVIEAHPERTDAKVMSEKIFRAIQTPRPWLLFASTGCVNKLRRLGFDVFDDLVDHSYDELDTAVNANSNIDIIVQEAKRLMHLKTTPAVIQRFEDGYKHNRTILKSWHQNWQAKCETFIDEVFEKAMEAP